MTTVAQVAGTDLDIAIATEVMGWHRGACKGGCESRKGHRSHEYAWHWYAADGSEQALAKEMGDYYQPQQAWSPSTEILDAWQVLDKLRYGPLWSEFTARVEDLAQLSAEHAALAICRAALTAIGH